MSESLGEPTGTIFDIQRFSVHDGPGIRTTVFMKGCPLRCVWCQNPEGLEGRVRVWCFENVCVGCGACYTVCPVGALGRGTGGKPVVDVGVCGGCGRCVEECSRNALAFDGREVTVGEVVDEVLKDRVFYEVSGGGVTFSGGEPLVQAGFVGAVAERLRGEGVSTAVETSLAVPWGVVEGVVGVIDYFQVDVKVVVGVRHEEVTGVANGEILANLRRLVERVGDVGRVRVRLPLVRGYTADEGNVRGVAAFVGGVDAGLVLELMNYNPLGEVKYRRMGKEYALMGETIFSDEEMEHFRKIAREETPNVI